MNRAAPERRWAQGSASPPLFFLPNAGSGSTERDPASQTVEPAFPNLLFLSGINTLFACARAGIVLR